MCVCVCVRKREQRDSTTFAVIRTGFAVVEKTHLTWDDVLIFKDSMDNFVSIFVTGWRSRRPI